MSGLWKSFFGACMCTIEIFPCCFSMCDFGFCPHPGGAERGHSVPVQLLRESVADAAFSAASRARSRPCAPRLDPGT